VGKSTRENGERGGVKDGEPLVKVKLGLGRSRGRNGGEGGVRGAVVSM